jgi:putative membrane protein
MLLFFKALHFIGFVAWFAGLFYLVRMFVYHVESSERPPEEAKVLVPQYNLMQWRVYRIICNPAMMITWAAGLTVIALYGWDWFKVSYWLHIKLILLIGLTVYHVWCKKIIIQLERGDMAFTSYQFRLWNEVPTLFLVIIEHPERPVGDPGDVGLWCGAVRGYEVIQKGAGEESKGVERVKVKVKRLK